MSLKKAVKINKSIVTQIVYSHVLHSGIEALISRRLGDS